MIELTIGPDAAGQRLERYLKKLMPGAKKGLLNKSLRKKNVTLNGHKSTPQQLIAEGDKVQIYFSDETFKKFRGTSKPNSEIPEVVSNLLLSPVYEDSSFLAVNKPAGLLTQPDKSGECSLSDAVSQKVEGSATFKPAPLNRLDRNTSGIVLIPKNYTSQKKGALALREGRAQKLYYALVSGRVLESGKLTDTYSKDTASNTAKLGDGTKEVSLSYRPVRVLEDKTLLEIELHSGKSHQIRAQLARAGWPILGDPKYGDKKINRSLKENLDINHQLLHAFKYILYNEDGSVMLEAEAPLPQIFLDTMQKAGV